MTCFFYYDVYYLLVVITGGFMNSLFNDFGICFVLTVVNVFLYIVASYSDSAFIYILFVSLSLFEIKVLISKLKEKERESISVF